MLSPKSSKECPFTIVVDSNEYLDHHLGYRFEQIDPRPSVVTVNLFVGDYTLLGCPDEVIVERKTLADLYASFGKKRENMIERISIMNSRFDFAAMVIEAEYSEVVNCPPRHTKLHPRSLSGTIIALKQRFPKVHWEFMPGRDAGERMTYRILERFYLDKIGGDDA
jgi:ERCC4-type nuclease